MSTGLGARQRGRVLFAMASYVALGTFLILWPTSLPVRWAVVRCAQVMPSQSLGKCDITMRYGRVLQSALCCVHQYLHPHLALQTPERNLGFKLLAEPVPLSNCTEESGVPTARGYSEMDAVRWLHRGASCRQRPGREGPRVHGRRGLPCAAAGGARSLQMQICVPGLIRSHLSPLPITLRGFQFVWEVS